MVQISSVQALAKSIFIATTNIYIYSCFNLLQLCHVVQYFPCYIMSEVGHLADSLDRLATNMVKSSPCYFATNSMSPSGTK